MQTKSATVVNNYYDESSESICLELYNEAWGRFVIPYYNWSQNYSKSSDLHPAKLAIGTKVLVRAYDPKSTGICEFDITKRLTPDSVSNKKLERDLDIPYMTVSECYKYADKLLKRLKYLKKNHEQKRSR